REAAVAQRQVPASGRGYAVSGVRQGRSAVAQSRRFRGSAAALLPAVLVWLPVLAGVAGCVTQAPADPGAVSAPASRSAQASQAPGAVAPIAAPVPASL